MLKVHKQIFPERGVRVRVGDIPGFPETHISAELVDYGDEGKIERRFQAMKKEFAALEERTKDWNPEDGMLEKLIERQKLDLLRVPLLVERAHDAVAEGRSMVIFVPYRATVQAICERLKVPHSRIWGGQPPLERQAQIDAFQFDRTRVCVTVSQASGENIDLHDIHGKYPRVTDIVPPYEAWLLRQIVGRVRRAGGKSRSLQRILFGAGTYEEEIYERCMAKSMNLDTLNDGDLTPTF
jgi:superfamily II DNA or RNA helicase